MTTSEKTKEALDSISKMEKECEAKGISFGGVCLSRKSDFPPQEDVPHLRTEEIANEVRDCMALAIQSLDDEDAPHFKCEDQTPQS